MAVLATALRNALAQPETAARFTAQGARVIGGTPAEAAAFIAGRFAHHAWRIKFLLTVWRGRAFCA